MPKDIITSQYDTIAAIATPIGKGAIGMVRMSGEGAIAIADKVCRLKNKQLPSDGKSHMMQYGHLIDSNDTVIDEVCITIMRKPKTYTCEDTVEITCHAGMIALRRVLDVLLLAGARLARPGEFTERAFLHGRIDLLQAEAVHDIITARTERGMASALEHLSGKVSACLNDVYERLLVLQSTIEGGIDFPDDIAELNPETLVQQLGAIYDSLEQLSSSINRGSVLREGVSIVLCGRPNVGKSSLFNALLGRNRAIVTEYAGTTRDTIEDTTDIRGVPVRWIDTAGIAEVTTSVEQAGIARSHTALALSDQALLVVDGSQPLTDDDRNFIELLKDKHYCIAINKMDLVQQITDDEVAHMLSSAHTIIHTCAVSGKGIDRLEKAVYEAIFSVTNAAADEDICLTNRRHAELVKEAAAHCLGAITGVREGLSSEFIAADIRASCECLDDITGRRYTDDLLEKIFSRFCIGK